MKNRRIAMSGIIEPLHCAFCGDKKKCVISDTVDALKNSFPQAEPTVPFTSKVKAHYLRSSPIFFARNRSKMRGSLAPKDVNFLPLQMAVFCAQCEMISQNNTPRCLACGSLAVLSLSRVLGGSLRGQQPHLIQDAELDRLVRSLLQTVPREAGEHAMSLPVALSFAGRHHLRLRGEPARQAHINPGELDLEPGISIIAEKAQSMTGATGAAIALRSGTEIVCRARTGRTAPDLGVRLQTDTGLSADCVRTGEVLLCNDAATNPRVDWYSCSRLGVRSILVAPLRHLRRTLGVFEVLSSRANAFDQDDVATMQFLSGMMVATMSRLAGLRPGAQKIAASE
jgi:putative methionine-R-sulfoxide reductase with GAF domain